MSEQGLARTLSPETLSAGAAPAPSTPSPSSSQRWTAERLPVIDPARYAVSGQVAQGGIGRVLRARDVQMDRPVAIKELLDGGRDAEDRFVREALLTSRLQHPSIVPVYEAGRWPTGAPFYAMKLVSGRSLAEVIGAARSLDARLPLVQHVLAVAQAMAYAHAERIIHRDLKPANVLVGDFGETVVIDWGLAKELEAEAQAPRLSAVPRDEQEADQPAPQALTMAGTIVGTPAYMPPEQAAGRPVGERADVYALGAILYHVLAGAPPYEGSSPLTVVKQVLLGPPPPLARRVRGVPEDLLAIVEKAMARRPEDRYPTARELADDLGRFLAGQLVGAHRYSRRELAIRFVRRHRGALSVAAAAVLMLVSIVAIAFFRIAAAKGRAEEAQQVAEDARRAAEAARQAAVERADQLVLVQAEGALDRDPNEALGWLRSLSPSFKDWDAARIIAADARNRGIPRVLRGHREHVNALSFSADGRTLYTASDDRTVRAWDVEGSRHRELLVHDGEAWSVRVSPDGRRIASSGLDRTIRVLDLETGAVKVLKGHTDAVVDAFFTPDGRGLVSFGDDAAVRAWDLETGAQREVASGTGVSIKAYFTPDRRHAAVVGHAGVLALLDIETGALRAARGVKVHAAVIPLMGIFPVDLLPDASLVAAGGEDGRIRLWDPGKDAVRELVGHEAPVGRVLFFPDGRRLASAAQDGTVRVWDLATGAARVYRGHEGFVSRIAISPDARWLASAGVDRTTRLWDLETDQRRVLAGARDTVYVVAFSPDSRTLAAGSSDGVVHLFQVDAGPSRILGRHAGAALALDLDPRGGRLATAGADGRVRIFSLAGGEQLVLSAHKGQAMRVGFSPDGARLASAGVDGVVRVFSAKGREERAIEVGGVPRFAFSPGGAQLAVAGKQARLVRLAGGEPRELPLPDAPQQITSLSFSPDGRQVVASSTGGAVRVWNTETGEHRIIGRHDGHSMDAVVSPDGAIIASGGWDRTLRLWNLVTGEHRAIDASGAYGHHLAFTPSGEQLLGLPGGSTASVWDGKDGSLRRELRGHVGEVHSIRASPDGRAALTTGEDGTVRLWDLATGRSQVMRGHAGPALEARFLPDGRGFVSIGKDGTVRLWPDDLPRDPEALRAWIAATLEAADPTPPGARRPGPG